MPERRLEVRKNLSRRVAQRFALSARMLSRCIKALNRYNKNYFNGNVAKHRFLNEVQVLAEGYRTARPDDQEAVMNIATLILHHLENEWVNAPTWKEGANNVWGIIRTIDYPREK
jgi:hypothetical protein